MEIQSEVYKWCDENQLGYSKHRILVFVQQLVGKVKEGTVRKAMYDSVYNYRVKLEEKNAELKKEITALRGSLYLLKRGLE
jgi:uncharacterized lipoprotein YajG